MAICLFHFIFAAMKVKFGMIVTEGRGKLGGHVFSKNRSGAIVRTKVTPINGKTNAQMSARGLLTTFSQNWAGLTQAQRDAWNGAVDSFKKTNIFGDQYKPTGKNLYTKLNINLALIGLAAISKPPLPPELPNVQFNAGPIDQTEILIEASKTFGGATAVISATASSSPGITNFSGKFRIIGVGSSFSADQTEDVRNKYINKFGTYPSGQKIGFSVVVIDHTSGVASPAQTFSKIVA